MRSRLTASALALLAVTLGGPTWAQDPGKPGGSTEQKFLGLDLFGGGAAYDTKQRQEDGTAVRGSGWDVGATVMAGVRWAGITGTVGHHKVDNAGVYSVLFGPRFYIGNPGARWIAHALVGVAHATSIGPSQTSGQFVVGGGLDLFILRLQFDYVRLNLPQLPKNTSRAFVGITVPLCLRSCSDSDYENFRSFGR